MTALEAGQKAGGDRRGKVSAALLVVNQAPGPNAYAEEHRPAHRQRQGPGGRAAPALRRLQGGLQDSLTSPRRRGPARPAAAPPDPSGPCRKRTAMHPALRVTSLALALAAAFCAPAAQAQAAPPAAAEASRILASPAYKAAVAVLDREHERIVEDGISLTEIPAPPFKEEARAREFEKLLKAVRPRRREDRRRGQRDRRAQGHARRRPLRRRLGAPRHRVSGRHRREGQAPGHAAVRAGHRRRHPEPGGAGRASCAR